MSKLATRLLTTVSVAAPVPLPLTAHADVPGHHPGFLDALTDLLTARSLMERLAGDRRVDENANVALSEAGAGVRDVKHAAIVDDKISRDHPMSDMQKHASRLRRAIEYLKQSRNDVARARESGDAQPARPRLRPHRATRRPASSRPLAAHHRLLTRGLQRIGASR